MVASESRSTSKQTFLSLFNTHFFKHCVCVCITWTIIIINKMWMNEI